jgi:hypothetical protein
MRDTFVFFGFDPTRDDDPFAGLDAYGLGPGIPSSFR